MLGINCTCVDTVFCFLSQKHLGSQSGVGDPKWGRKLSQMGSQGSAGVAQSKCN